MSSKDTKSHIVCNSTQRAHKGPLATVHVAGTVAIFDWVERLREKRNGNLNIGSAVQKSSKRSKHSPPPNKNKKLMSTTRLVAGPVAMLHWVKGRRKHARANIFIYIQTHISIYVSISIYIYLSIYFFLFISKERDIYIYIYIYIYI